MATAIVVLACWLQVRLHPEAEHAVLLQNIQWTLAFAVGAWMAWSGYRASSPELAIAKRHQFLGLLCLGLGQVVWDVQAYVAWTPFPGPSDLVFFPSTVFFLTGFLALVRRDRWTQVLADVAGFALGAGILTLTLYLSVAGESRKFQLFVLCSYPVGMLSAGACFVILQLHDRQRWRVGSLALGIGICALGLTWMSWNLGQLKGEQQLGTMTSLAFSLSALTIGWASYVWRSHVDTSASYDRLCEGVLRQLPLVMVALTTSTLGLLAVGDTVPHILRTPLVWAAFLVLVFAVYRQTRSLSERDRLLAAERVVLESQAKLQHLAHHDPLTGLPNLTLLRDRVDQATETAGRHGTKFALMFIDLDNFKEVNDTLGHDAGDALLCTIAERFQSLLRATDTVSRQGGDEFSIVLHEVQDLAQVSSVAEKLSELANGYLSIQHQEIPLSFSVGIAMFPDDASDFAGLMRCADTAMYKAKAAGGRTYRFYDAKMNDEAASRMRIRSHLARAVEKNELSLLWQAQVDLSNGSFCGVEALVRWTHPELGQVSPATFIPVAETTGHILPIGTWILHTACRQAAAWLAQGLQISSISVNISMVQFIRGNVELQVAEALRSSGLPPSLLKLEITESVFMHDKDTVLETVDRLVKLGVKLSIDDFGTGYSSLSCVQRLKVDAIKVDQSFVRGLPGNAGSCAIVKAVIDMAKAMELAVVAEGVETQEQCDWLRQNGCGIAQGYLFSKPLGASDFENLWAHAAWRSASQNRLQYG
ncbi:putative bifunctional diguanylate cyclase/phosphodiesterase [Rhodoferax aquaticus]|uniref:putative bifunctional diguanylate cyclase/phosphodiesterase n=1 Tax=Rhodoferax aquaticus TaxID=2527691 RepID=UPI00143DABA7|nr:EAL domain-containing protein [Rhodoferax aquaticus]